MGVPKNPREAGIDTKGMEEFKSNLDIERSKDSGRREFAFGMSLSLGIASNNYAEYSGLIIAQLIFSMFKQKDISIATDSQLIVNQVKGLAKTKNFRLVDLIKIVHSLAFKFTSMGLDYVPRELNTIADSLAKEASGGLAMEDKPYKFYFRLEKVM